MSVIGQQIKKYRIAKGITQEQLGELVGVTTQAVSKWERGGTPDAELLPALARVLSVSIDALYGLGDENLSLTIARRIHSMPNEEAYRFAFNICWSIQNAMFQGVLAPEELTDEFIDRLTYDEKKVNFFAKIMRDEGMCITRLTPGLNCFFLMKEPKNGIKNCIADVKALTKVFKVFANEDILSIIYYMYSRLNTPLSSSLISKNTGISIQKVEEYMDDLLDANLVEKSTIETADGEMYSYMFTNENAVIPLLIYADEITKRDIIFNWSFSRTKPLLK